MMMREKKRACSNLQNSGEEAALIRYRQVRYELN